jgi:hypothetical protein
MSGRRALRLLRRFGLTVVLLATALPALATKGAKPQFGPNVLIFDPSMPSQAIQKQIDAVYATQQHNEFGPQRNALLFLPGNYSVNLPVGFYTEVIARTSGTADCSRAVPSASVRCAPSTVLAAGALATTFSAQSRGVQFWRTAG